MTSLNSQEGLKVQSGIDTNTHKKGMKVTDSKIAVRSLIRDKWCGERSYTFSLQLKVISGQIISIKYY